MYLYLAFTYTRRPPGKEQGTESLCRAPRLTQECESVLLVFEEAEKGAGRGLKWGVGGGRPVGQMQRQVPWQEWDLNLDLPGSILQRSSPSSTISTRREG